MNNRSFTGNLQNSASPSRPQSSQFDSEMETFFMDVNEINILIHKRKRFLEAKISRLKSELDCMKQLKSCPVWIHSYLDKEKQLKDKIQRMFSGETTFAHASSESAYDQSQVKHSFSFFVISYLCNFAQKR